MRRHLLDTPASRRLLALLEKTAALAVDRERGWLDSDGESVGMPESVEQLAIGLRYDVHGAPDGRD